MPRAFLKKFRVEKQSPTSVIWRTSGRYTFLEDAMKAIERAELIRGAAMRIVDVERDLVIKVRHG